MKLSQWKRCESVLSGGKAYFYVLKVADYGPPNWGYHRIVWHRDVRAYALTTDQKHGDRPTLHGYFDTPQKAAEALDGEYSNG